MAGESKILCRVYSISPSRFSSLCEENGPDVDGIVSSDGKLFGDGDRFTITLSNDENLNPRFCKSSLLIDVWCKAFTLEKIRYLRNIPSNDDNLDDDEDNPDQPLITFLKENVLRNHGIKSGQNVWLHKASTLSLSTVVLKSASRYKLDDELVLKISDYFREKVRVVRENDILAVQKNSDFQDRNLKNGTCQLNFDVLKCEPISQGVIDTKTNFILLKASENSLEEEETSSEIKQPEDSTSSGNLAMLNLLVAEFTTPLQYIWRDRSLMKHKAMKLKAQVNDWMDLHQSFLGSGYLGNSQDIYSCHCIYVSLATLMEIGVQNGSWVKVWVQEETSVKNVAKIPDQKNDLSSHSINHSISGQVQETQPNKKLIGYHYAQIYAVEPQGNISQSQNKSQHSPVFQSNFETSNHIVNISSLLLFNLVNNSSMPTQDGSELILRVIPYSTEMQNISEAKGNSNHPLFESIPPYAKEVHLSLVYTVLTRLGCVFDKILERYFTKPRLLTLGDVFCVQSNGYSSPSDIDYQGLENCVIYFKVMKLICTENETVSCLADIEHTSVYQASAVQSFVPILQAPSENSKDRLNYWNLIPPPGLERSSEELSSVIQPYLRQNVQLMPTVLITGPEGAGKKTIVMAVGRQLGLLTMNINCYGLIGDSVAATEARISNIFQKAILCRPCILLLRNIDKLAKDRDGLEDEPRISNTLQHSIKELQELSTWPVVVIATSSSSFKMSAQTRSCFLHEVKVHTPSEEERKRILESLASMSCVSQDVSFGLVSKRTAGFVLADIVSLFTKATSSASRRIYNHYIYQGNELLKAEIAQLESFSKNDCKKNTDDESDLKVNKLLQDISNCGPKIVLQDLQDALQEIQSEHSDAIGGPKIPSVSWRDIGGLLDVKTELLDTIQLPLQHPELFASGLRRSGVLLYGPPGTGKTLLAKAVATECSLNFLSVKGPELINMYVGQSEENIRHVFTRAQSASPCVIFFDELDSLAPNRGRSGDSGGVMDRVVSQLLAELDGLHKSCDVFVIGATNRPDLLDPALLRPGRFDKLLYLGISEDHESQLKILKALTSKFELSPDCDLESISQQCPLNFTGADLYALCSDAMLHAIKRCLPDQLDDHHDDDEVESSFTVNRVDFQEALEGIIPSVTEHELQRYERIREQFAS